MYCTYWKKESDDRATGRNSPLHLLGQDASDTFTWSTPRLTFSSQIPDSPYHDRHCLWLTDDVLFYANGYFTWDSRPNLIDGSSSDQEVIDVGLEIYECIKGQKYHELKKLNGSYLLLFFDQSIDQLIVITDRLSTRQLFHHQDAERTILSEDIREILKFPSMQQELDIRSIVEFLRFTMILENRTLYKDITVLPPGSILTINREGSEFKTYWEMRFDESWNQSDQYYVEKIAWAFQQAVNSMFNNTDGVALMLSGGLDSRMITAALTSVDSRIPAISFGGFENEEIRLAKRVAKEADFPFHFIQRESNHYFQIIEQASQISNGLYNFYHAHMLGTEKQIRALGIHTLIHGWGLDVPFSASYLPKRTVHHLPGRYFQLIWPQALSSSQDVTNKLYESLNLPFTENAKPLASENIRKVWEEWPEKVIGSLVQKAEQHARDYYNQYDYFLMHNFTKFRSYLYPLSVRQNFRERCPMYDSDVIDTFLQLPPRLRFCSRAYGRAMKRLDSQVAHLPYNRIGTSILYPEILQTLSYFLLPTIREVKYRWRLQKGHYPQHIYEKHDSYPRIGELFRTIIGQRKLSSLLEGSFFDLGIVNKDTVEYMLNAHLTSKLDYSEQIAVLASLSTWFTPTILNRH